MRIFRYVIPVVMSALLGAGCGSAPAQTPSTTADMNAQQDLNLPGVPYGTKKKAEEDIKKAMQAEQNWQKGAR